MRKKIVAGNWKMNGSKQSIKRLLSDIRELQNTIPEQVNLIVFPATIYIPLVQEILGQQSPIAYGAQNLSFKDEGAYTGEVSALMLKDFDCKFVLVGHSERRKLFAEDEKIIAEKFHQAKDHDMIPVLCVGETLEEREKGLTEQVVRQQISSVAKTKESFKNSIIAYEPVWAIGTGLTAIPDQVQEVHVFIRSILAEYDEVAAQLTPILYGGSVNEKNAAGLFKMPDVDGGLIGGASLNAQQFVEIAKCIKSY